MRLAKIVVETLPGRARAVAEDMGHIKGMAALSSEGDHRVVGTWTIPENDTLEGISEVLQAMNPEILEVYPTFVGEDQAS
ncbi:MAG TPA: hypothetical protein VI589_00560 [Vicinamibacteria bacterium]|jgi:nucleoid-associated protein YgaU